MTINGSIKSNKNWLSLTLFTKTDNFLWLCWLLAKNLNSMTHYWNKLHNRKDTIMYSMLLYFFLFWSQTPMLYCQPHHVAWSPRVLGRSNFGSFCWNYFRMRPTQRSSLGREPMASSNSLIQMKSRENGERGNQNQTWITTRWAEHWGQLQVFFFFLNLILYTVRDTHLFFCVNGNFF